MRTRGDIFLLVFLAFGILFYLLTIQFAGDSSINSSRNSLAKGTDTLRVSPSRDTTQVLHRGSFLENYDLKAMGYNSSRYAHTLYQTMNLAFADRDFYYGDPAFPPVEPIEGLLSKEYAKARMKQIDPKKK